MHESFGLYGKEGHDWEDETPPKAPELCCGAAWPAPVPLSRPHGAPVLVPTFTTSPHMKSSRGGARRFHMRRSCKSGYQNRCAHPNSSIMIHEPSATIKGHPTDYIIQLKELLNARARLCKIYSHHSGQPIELIEKVERDMFMTAEEAKEFGLIDEVVQARRSNQSD